MKVAVTGATGFLGHYVVNHLLAAGHDCRCWFRPGSDQGGFFESGKNLQWVQGQLADEQAAEALVRGVDAVVHAALARGQADLVDFAQVNLMGSLQLMQAARQAGVERFLFISTCAVHEKILDDRPLDEAHPLWPAGQYGAYKASVEKFVHSYGIGEGWPISSLRPTGIYGLARPAQKSRWLEIVRQVMVGRHFPSSAGGKEVHAADVAKAVGILLEAPGAKISGQAYNCYDLYVAQQDVAQLTSNLAGGGRVEKLNRGPKHQIDTSKIQDLGMVFGGRRLLEKTVGDLVEIVRKERK